MANELGAGHDQVPGDEIVASDVVLPAGLAAEQDAAAIDLTLHQGPADASRPEPFDADGASYSGRFEDVPIDYPRSGPAGFRQRSNHDVINTLSVYGNESVPVLSDGGKLAYTSAGLVADRVHRLQRGGALPADQEVTVWVIDNHGVHAKVFLDALRTTDQATYDRTRVVVVNQSEETLQTIQARNVLDEHERVSYRTGTNLSKLQHQGDQPLAIIAPDLPNQQDRVFQVFHKNEAEADQPAAYSDYELQLGVRAKGDLPLVTINPESGLTDIAPLDNFLGLGAAQSTEGRQLIHQLNGRIAESRRDVPIADSPLRRIGQTVHATLESTRDKQLYNFTPSQANPVTALIEQLSPHGMFLTSGYMNAESKLSPNKLRRDIGQLSVYTAEAGQLAQQADRAHTPAMYSSLVLPRDGDYGFALFDTTTSAHIRQHAAEQFNSDAGVRAPDESRQIIDELLAAAADAEANTDVPALYASVLESHPRLLGNYDLTVAAAKALNDHGNHAHAAAVAEAAIQLAPHVCTTALVEAGKAYRMMQQPATAVHMLNWALDISPNATSVHHEMMRLYREQRQWDNYIVAAGRFLRDERTLTTEQTIKIMRGIISAAEQEKQDSVDNPFSTKTVIIESLWIDRESGEPQIERQIRYLPRWMMAQIKAADLSANYAETVRRLLDYEDGMEKEAKVTEIEWFNQKYEQHSLRQDPTDPDSFIGERELWPDRTVRALWPDLAQDQTHRLIYTGESTLVTDEYAAPDNLLSMMAHEPRQAGRDNAEQVATGEAQPRVAHVELGLIPDSMGRRPSTHYANLEILNRHALIVGESGSGKSNAARNILEQLSVAGIPWLVIEASKSEYGTMAGRLEAKAQELGIQRGADGLLPTNFEVYVIKPGDTDALHQTPAALNFLAPEPGFPILSHIDMVQNSLLAAFQGDEPFPQVMSQALVRVYEKHGWDMTTGYAAPGGREPTTPTLEDLIETAMEIIDGAGYEKNKEDVKGFVRMRIQSLGVGSLGNFLEGPNSFDFDDLQSRNVVLNLDKMGDDKMKAFLTAMFMSKRNEYLQLRDEQQRKARSAKTGEVQDYGHRLAHFTMFEEAARLLKTSSNQASDSAVSKIASSFALVRAYGEGIGAICQSVKGLHEEVMKNTALKWVFRTSDGDEQATLASHMNIDAARASRFSGLKTGQGYVYRSGDSGPVPVYATYGGSREREMPNRMLPPIRGRHASIRQASEHDIHEAEIAIGASTPEAAWMRSWVEFMTMAYVAGKQLPKAPDELQAHANRLSPLQRQLQIRKAVGSAVARRSSVLTTFDPARLQASIESAANSIIEHNVGAGTLAPREFVVPQLKLLAEDAVVHRPFRRGLKADPDDTAPPLQHHVTNLADPRDHRATFAERVEVLGSHPLSMRHPNERVSSRNATIGYIAMFGKDGARQLFDEDMALATGGATISAQTLTMTRAMGIAGGPATVGWGVEILSYPKRIFRKYIASQQKATAKK